MSKKKATLSSIAAVAGVSIGTVDRVLHQRGRVSPQTEKKVLQLLEQLDYRPNLMARQLKLEKEYQICAVLPELDSESGYWRLLYRGIEQAQRELELFPFSLKLLSFNRRERSSFLDAVTQTVAIQPDAVIWAPIAGDDSLTMVQKLSTSIPYVYVDTAVPVGQPLTAIAQDSFRSGLLAGRLMHHFLQEGSVAVVCSFLHAHNLAERQRGFHHYVTHHQTRLQVVDCRGDYHDLPSCQRWTRSLAKRFPQVKGIFCLNSSVHLLGEAAAGHFPSALTIIGYDLVPENAAALAAGSIDCIISQTPVVQGCKAVYTLYKKFILAQDIPAEIDIPIEVIFQENMAGREDG